MKLPSFVVVEPCEICGGSRRTSLCKIGGYSKGKKHSSFNFLLCRRCYDYVFRMLDIRMKAKENQK